MVSGSARTHMDASRSFLSIDRWLPLFSAIVYFLSDPRPQNHYDYTFRVAGNFLIGRIGFTEPQPSWLNEFVPFNGAYYSVFPLGAVLSMLPAALLQYAGAIAQMPGQWIAAVLAGVSCWLLIKIARSYGVSSVKAALLASAFLFGTFLWTNLTFAGAWQLALGFAFAGELGAIYFTVVDRRPVLAGACFALAFGNRTEVLLTAPIFYYLLIRDRGRSRVDPESPLFDRTTLYRSAGFTIFPLVLGLATLWYNIVRFGSPADFGYDKIPGVLSEPWYRDGIFSTSYIPGQAWEMLLRLWHIRGTFPYVVPDGFSSSILLSSPFLLLIFRVGAKDGGLKLASWVAISAMTLLLWTHGNSGGWQFGYRYAIVLLPWMLVIMLESGRERLSKVEAGLIAFSIAANAYATWLFHWTDYLKQ